MFVQTLENKQNNKIYKSVFLIENYREGKKVKHRYIANLSKVPEDIVNQIDAYLKGKEVVKIDELKRKQGKSCGGLIVAIEIIKRLGIFKALGNSRNAQITLLQILARLFTQGSQRNILNTWVKNQAISECLKIDDINIKELYNNLSWLSDNQRDIEKKLFKFRTGISKINSVYLYDVTSSYLEGEHNELAAYGYNRDKKRGKKQIVIGLLCDENGYPVSIEVFRGNTCDTKTVSSQLEKLSKLFGIENVIFVGDKGMIKTAQIEELNKEPYKWNYITSITKAQIRTLLNNEIIQLGMFDENLFEVEYENVRYITRRNPVRAEEIQRNRKERIEKIKQKAAQKTTYLSEHPKAKENVALREINTLIKKHKFSSDIISCQIVDRKTEITVHTENIPKLAELDGCYVIKTDVNKTVANAKTIHDRYKDLSTVEQAFGVIKTGLEEIRPIYLRKEKHTRGHVFICMLTYIIAKYLKETFKNTDYTLNGVLESLDKIQYSTIEINNINLKLLPDELLPHQNEIIEKLKIKLPRNL
jgi:transposase